MFTYFIEVPDLLTLQVLGIHVFGLLEMVNDVTCLLDFNLRHAYLTFCTFDWNIFALETPDESTY